MSAVKKDYKLGKIKPLTIQLQFFQCRNKQQFHVAGLQALTAWRAWDLNLHWVVVGVVAHIYACLLWPVQRVGNVVGCVVPTGGCLTFPIWLRACTPYMSAPQRTCRLTMAGLIGMFTV